MLIKKTALGCKIRHTQSNSNLFHYIGLEWKEELEIDLKYQKERKRISTEIVDKKRLRIRKDEEIVYQTD